MSTSAVVVAETACLVWACTEVIVLGVAIRRARVAFSERERAHTASKRIAIDDTSPLATRDDVLLVRPLAGDERGLEERLVARGAVTRVVLAVRSEDDAAIPAAHAAVARLGTGASLVMTHAEGPNMKASQLAAVVADHAADATILVIADSDVALVEHDVSALLGALASDPKLGAAWSPVTFDPRASGDAMSAGDRATTAILVGSLHAFPLLAGLDGGLFVGKLFAIRTSALAAAGGFASQAGVLGEDVALARALREAGFATRRIGTIARATRAGGTLREAVDRMARWIFVVKGQRPALLVSYPLLLAGILPLALAVAVLEGVATASTGPLFALAAALAARLAVSLEGRRLAGLRRGLFVGLGDIVIADVVLALAFVRALVSRKLAWRGEALRLDGGLLTRLE